MLAKSLIIDIHLPYNEVMERFPYDMEYDLDLLVDDSEKEEPNPAIKAYMDQYITEDFPRGGRLILRKDSVQAAHRAADMFPAEEDGCVAPIVADILAEGSINPNLN
jgi:hypothetical protein